MELVSLKEAKQSLADESVSVSKRKPLFSNRASIEPAATFEARNLTSTLIAKSL